MGILDEAIREHLDLKRRRGATASELDQLEHEAFGPPTRPGEPDFPESPQEGADAGSEAETAFMPAEPGPGEGVSEGEAVALADEGAGALAEDEAQAALAEDETPREPVESEHVEPDSATLFYDQGGGEELEVGDLTLEDDAEREPAPSDVVGEPPPSVGEPPIESLETVEHPMEELVEPAPDEEHAAPAGEPGVATEDDAEPAPEAEEEPGGDVLEETPEFLRDQPEDDELWFEQGEPKDFDF